ncbi:MAG: hypothetical protein ACP5PJ_05825 [Acidimicrobiales bacterium]
MSPVRCRSCESVLDGQVSYCPFCGAKKTVPRRRWIAILIAAIATYWSFAYTYRRDKVKFWIGFAVSAFAVLELSQRYVFAIGIIIWAWSIIDRVLKPTRFYEEYPNG